MKKRFFLKSTAALLATCSFGLAQAQNTPIKFQLDWRFEGPSALFLTPVAKGYFKDAKLDVTVDAGNGSGGAVTRVADQGVYGRSAGAFEPLQGAGAVTVLNLLVEVDGSKNGNSEYKSRTADAYYAHTPQQQARLSQQNVQLKREALVNCIHITGHAIHDYAN